MQSEGYVAPELQAPMRLEQHQKGDGLPRLNGSAKDDTGPQGLAFQVSIFQRIGF